MERKLKVAEMATLLNVVPKTIYKMIEREELLTVTEKVNNRQTTLIITNDEQIAEFRKQLGKDTVSNSNYYENVTENEQLRMDNNGYKQVNFNDSIFSSVEVIDRILSLNDRYNEQLKEVNDELIAYKSQQLLLQDSKNREGLLLKDINELRTDIEKEKTVNEQLRIRNERLITILISSIIMFILVIIGLITINVMSKPVTEQEVEQVAPKIVQPTPTEAKAPVKAVKKR